MSCFTAYRSQSLLPMTIGLLRDSYRATHLTGCVPHSDGEPPIWLHTTIYHVPCDRTNVDVVVARIRSESWIRQPSCEPCLPGIIGRWNQPATGALDTREWRKSSSPELVGERGRPVSLKNIGCNDLGNPLGRFIERILRQMGIARRRLDIAVAEHQRAAGRRLRPGQHMSVADPGTPRNRSGRADSLEAHRFGRIGLGPAWHGRFRRRRRAPPTAINLDIDDTGRAPLFRAASRSKGREWTSTAGRFANAACGFAARAG